MRRAQLVLASLLWANLALAARPIYGPDDPIGRLIAHADSLATSLNIDDPGVALSWILTHGDEGSLALLETTIADSATADGYKQWLLEQIPISGGGQAADEPCGGLALLTRLLAPGRLRPEAWALSFQSFASMLSRNPECVSLADVDLLERKLADPEFTGYFSAARVLGSVGTHAASDQVRHRARALFWHYFDAMAVPEGRFAISPSDLDYTLFANFFQLPFRHPEDLDRELLGRTVAQLDRAEQGGVAKGQSASLLLSILRERPDLCSSVDWATLRATLMPDTPERYLREAQGLTVANLLPYAPQWADDDMEALLLGVLAHSDSGRVVRGRELHFGGATQALAACAIYGQDAARTRRILAHLMALAQDPARNHRAQSEAIAGLEAIVWNRPALVDTAFKQALRARLARVAGDEPDFAAERVLDLLGLTLELRPDLIAEGDLSCLGARIGGESLLETRSLSRTLLILATRGPEPMCRQIETLLREAQSAQAADAYNVRKLLGEIRRARGQGPLPD